MHAARSEMGLGRGESNEHGWKGRAMGMDGREEQWAWMEGERNEHGWKVVARDGGMAAAKERARLARGSRGREQEKAKGGPKERLCQGKAKGVCQGTVKESQGKAKERPRKGQRRRIMAAALALAAVVCLHRRIARDSRDFRPLRCTRRRSSKTPTVDVESDRLSPPVPHVQHVHTYGVQSTKSSLGVSSGSRPSRGPDSNGGSKGPLKGEFKGGLKESFNMMPCFMVPTSCRRRRRGDCVDRRRADGVSAREVAREVTRAVTRCRRLSNERGPSPWSRGPDHVTHVHSWNAGPFVRPTSDFQTTCIMYRLLGRDRQSQTVQYSTYCLLASRGSLLRSTQSGSASSGNLRLTHPASTPLTRLQSPERPS
ncbi:hypothetical protein BJ875DRAFT_527004 [Amylocarpus encephaloides]|uniref:Uncharacterized protein n=1 Tax=Amylocarpus encephaloides TaxID=45428 RepID=A0A9P7YSU9_9HELO|nr:hypothetical protein BJ875DRAFT_527004 [Amylocarpus encephaloides]